MEFSFDAITTDLITKNMKMEHGSEKKSTAAKRRGRFDPHQSLRSWWGLVD
jgi:hypothetical protein